MKLLIIFVLSLVLVVYTVSGVDDDSDNEEDNGWVFVDTGLIEFSEINPKNPSEYKEYIVHYKLLEDYLLNFVSDEYQIPFIIQSIQDYAVELKEAIQKDHLIQDILEKIQKKLKISVKLQQLLQTEWFMQTNGSRKENGML